METKFFQQGDCLLQVAEIPKEAKVTRGAVLVEGSATGHQHAVKGSKQPRLYKVGEKLFVKALGVFSVTHPEHKPIEIPAGTYEVRGVQEYDHFAEEARRVQD